jgi:2,3,4,5-tetrahydropyridine-2,6-dicarboxylate N-succinyltransferase
MLTLEARISTLADSGRPERTPENLALLAEFRAALNRGEMRVAEPAGEHWKTNIWVKKGILLHVALGSMRGDFEDETFPRRELSSGDQVRIPAGNTCIRDGAYLGPGVTCMPGLFVDIGAYIGSGTLLESNVTIGIGSQIGERVSIGSGTNVGSLLGPPADRLPTVICDEVVMGGNCGIYGGVYVGRGAVISAGTIVTAQSRVYDLVKKQYFKSQHGQPLAVPPKAIVAPGARALRKGPAAGSGLLLQLPVIVGYRDDPALGEDFLAALMD